MAAKRWKSWANWIRRAIFIAEASRPPGIHMRSANSRRRWIYWVNRGFLHRSRHVLWISLLTAGLAWPQSRPLQRPPVEAPEPYNQLDSSPTLFYVLAAVNAAGYDEQANSATNNPLRAKVRDYLAKQNVPSLAPLRRFVRDHKPKNPAAELSQY